MPTLSSTTEHSTTARPSRLRLSLLAALLTIFAVVNLGNALHKGGDFDVFLDAGQRVIDNRPLYADSAVAHGFIGPPFQAFFFVPSAWIASASPAAAKISWYVLNLIALVGGAWLWMHAIVPMSRHATLSFTSTLLPWALLAIVLPAQTNFEHQNMNALLLCLTGAAAWALTNRHGRLAGCFIGLAAALKAFPALLLVYLAMRREWTAVFAGALTAIVLTGVAPALVFGAPTAVELLDAWLQINRDGGWPVRIQNQSLYAMASRLSPEHGMALSAAMSIGLLALLVWIAVERRGSGRPLAGELALVLVASVLLSPIAWDHYWVLMLPALVFIASDDHPKRWHVFAAAALLISGPSPMLPGDVFNLFRTWSSSTIAGLVLIAWSTYRLIADARPTRTPVAHKLW